MSNYFAIKVLENPGAN